MKTHYLRELIKIKNGKDYKGLNSGNVPVYGTGGIMTYVDEFIFDGESVLLPRKGSLANIMFVSGKFWTVDTMYWTEVNTEIVYPRYLYYYLSLLDLSSRDSGSTLPSMTFESYYQLEIIVPSKEVQRRILDAIEPIDKKIEANNRINDNLINQMQYLFNYWFVQYNFPDKSGKPYKQNNGSFCNVKTLNIPSCWEIKQISDIATISTDSVNPRKMNNCIMEHYSIPAFDASGYPAFETADSIESNKYIVYPDSLLVSKLNPQFKRLWNPQCITKNSICSTEFIVYRSKHVEFRPFLYCLLNSESFHSHMKKNAISSTGSRKRIQPERSASFCFGYPNDEDVLYKFSKMISPLMEKQKSISLENAKLTEIKNWLLPLLMNGQATISE